jgi:hypothetical protein
MECPRPCLKFKDSYLKPSNGRTPPLESIGIIVLNIKLIFLIPHFSFFNNIKPSPQFVKIFLVLKDKYYHGKHGRDGIHGNHGNP